MKERTWHLERGFQGWVQDMPPFEKVSQNKTQSKRRGTLLRQPLKVTL